MKNNKSRNVLLVAFVLLAGVNLAAAASKGACVSITPATAGGGITTSDTCTCPTGTGTFTSPGVGSSESINPGSTISTANGALLLCDDLLPGYYITGASTTTSTIAICPVGKYCPGLASVFGGTGGSLACAAGGTGTGTEACGTATDAGVNYDTANGFDGTLTDGSKGGAIACTAGFGIGGTVAKSAATGCNSIAPGYYLPAVAASGAAPAVTLCIAGSYCPGVANAGSAVSGITKGTNTVTGTAAAGGYAGEGLTGCPGGTTSGAVVASGAAGIQINIASYPSAPLAACSVVAAGYYLPVASGTAALCTKAALSVATTAGSCSIPTPCIAGFYCPAGTTSVLSLNGATVTDLTAQLTFQGKTGSTAAGLLLVSTAAVTTSTNTPCPTGFTNTGSNTYVDESYCTDVAPGYYIGTSLVVSTVQNLAAAVALCPSGKYCPGKTSVIAQGDIDATASTWNGATGTFVTKATAAAVTIAANTIPNAIACPTGTGNAVTGAAAQGVNAVSLSTGCVDLLPGYAFIASVTQATSTLASLITTCAAGTYGTGCGAGLAGLFVAVPTLTGTGLTLATGTSLVLNAATTVTATVSTAATGSLIVATCPTGSTNTAAGATIASCLVQPGYYVDHSDLNCASTGPPAGCAVCPAGEYCPGGGAVGTAGGDITCPTGSVGPTASSPLNSNIADCVLSAGFYTTSAAPNVPAPCPSGFICAGGAALGTIGGVGSVACPTGSTNPSCITPAGPASVTTGNTTVNGSPVTVTPGAQPIFVNITQHSPTVASAAPLAAAAHSAVLALAALLALVAF